MRKILTFAIIVAMPAVLLASGHHEGAKNYDILWRSINFFIFFGILFYLLKEPVKKAYNDRINSIANRLEEIQNKLKETKEKKEQSVKNLEAAKTEATSLIDLAKKEAKIAEDKIKDNLEFEMQNMQKRFEEQKDFENRKITKAVVDEILVDIFDKNVNIDQNRLADMLSKKVM